MNMNRQEMTIALKQLARVYPQSKETDRKIAISASSGDLILRRTIAEKMSLEWHIPVHDTIQPGNIVAPLNLLRNILDTLHNYDSVGIVLTDKLILKTLQTDNNIYNIDIAAFLIVYPSPIIIDKKNSCRIRVGADFFAALKSVAFAIDKSKHIYARKNLQGVYIEIPSDSVNMQLTATNGHSLKSVLYKAQTRTKKKQSISIILPADAVNFLAGVTKDVCGNNIEIWIDDARKYLHIIATHWMYSIALLTDKYPDWRNVIPVIDNRNTIIINRIKLIEACQATLSIAQYSPNNPITITLDDDNIVILSASNNIGYSSAVLMADIKCQDKYYCITVIGKFLIALLRYMTGEYITMHIYEELKHIISIISNEEDGINLIMPIECK